MCPWPPPVPIQICLYYIGAALRDVLVAGHVTDAAGRVCGTKRALVKWISHSTLMDGSIQRI